MSRLQIYNYLISLTLTRLSNLYLCNSLFTVLIFLLSFQSGLITTVKWAHALGQLIIFICFGWSSGLHLFSVPLKTQPNALWVLLDLSPPKHRWSLHYVNVHCHWHAYNLIHLLFLGFVSEKGRNKGLVQEKGYFLKIWPFFKVHWDLYPWKYRTSFSQSHLCRSVIKCTTLIQSNICSVTLVGRGSYY